MHAAREALRAALGRALEAEWRDAYGRNAANRYEYSPAAKGARRLRTVALNYLLAAAAADAPGMAKRQFDEADNMTDRQGALAALAATDAPERPGAIAAFYERYKGDALVLDKWFMVQALSPRDDTPQAVEALAKHPDFTLANPNRMRSLVGAFAMNQRAFHDAVGARLPLPCGHDPRRRQDEPADGGAAGASPRPLEALRPGAPGADEGRAGTHRRHPGPVEGRVRAGEQEPGLTLTGVPGRVRDGNYRPAQSATSPATWFAATFSAAATVAASAAAAGARASKRLVVTPWPGRARLASNTTTASPRAGS